MCFRKVAGRHEPLWWCHSTASPCLRASSSRKQEVHISPQPAVLGFCQHRRQSGSNMSYHLSNLSMLRLKTTATSRVAVAPHQTPNIHIPNNCIIAPERVSDPRNQSHINGSAGEVHVSPSLGGLNCLFQASIIVFREENFDLSPSFVHQLKDRHCVHMNLR